MSLTGEEFLDCACELSAAYLARMANPPAKGRKRRLVYPITLPRA